MSQYIVSARKYRPDSFESLIGQDNIARTLKNSIIRGQLAHAYLFCGPRGVGKTSAARIFAKTINCANPGPDMEPCGECESCISFKEGRSYCIHELDAASNNSVEDIKMLIDQVNVPPQTGKYSVFIVDEVHMLSLAAFNAFLKTLEEPPAHAIFILATTEKHKILPTILSRCQTFDFGRISVPDIVKNLRGIATKEGITIDDESLHIIALKADGAMRDALTIFDQTVAFCGTEVAYADVLKNLNVLDYDHCFSLVDSFLAGDYDAALLRFDDILSKGFNALHFVGSLSSHLRDLLVARSGGLRALLDLPESLVARYQEQAQRCSPRFLYEALAATTACESGYKASINPRLHIEFCLLRLCNLCKEMPGQAGHDGASSVISSASSSVISSERSESRNLNTKPQSTEISPLRPSASGRNDNNSASGRNDNDLAPAPKRGRRAPGAMSLNALRTDEAPAAAPQPAAQPKEEKPLQQEQIKQQWLELAKAYVSRTRLYTTLTGAKLSFAEEDGITTLTFSVQNTAQMDWIKEKLLRELEGKLCQMLSTTKLKLDIDVIPDEEVKQTSYTSREQAQELMQSNPEVLNLVKDMGLDA